MMKELSALSAGLSALVAVLLGFDAAGESIPSWVIICLSAADAFSTAVVTKLLNTK